MPAGDKIIIILIIIIFKTNVKLPSAAFRQKLRYCLSFHHPFCPAVIEEFANLISIISGLAVVKP